MPNNQWPIWRKKTVNFPQKGPESSRFLRLPAEIIFKVLDVSEDQALFRIAKTSIRGNSLVCGFLENEASRAQKHFLTVKRPPSCDDRKSGPQHLNSLFLAWSVVGIAFLVLANYQHRDSGDWYRNLSAHHRRSWENTKLALFCVFTALVGAKWSTLRWTPEIRDDSLPVALMAENKVREITQNFSAIGIAIYQRRATNVLVANIENILLDDSEWDGASAGGPRIFGELLAMGSNERLAGRLEEALVSAIEFPPVLPRPLLKNLVALAGPTRTSLFWSAPWTAARHQKRLTAILHRTSNIPDHDDLLQQVLHGDKEVLKAYLSHCHRYFDQQGEHLAVHARLSSQNAVARLLSKRTSRGDSLLSALLRQRPPASDAVAIAAKLIQHGASVEGLYDDGQTSLLELAKAHHDPKMADLFRRHGESLPAATGDESKTRG